MVRRGVKFGRNWAGKETPTVKRSSGANRGLLPVDRQVTINGGGAVVEVLGGFHIAEVVTPAGKIIWTAYIVDGCIGLIPLWNKLHAKLPGLVVSLVYHTGDVGGYLYTR